MPHLSSGKHSAPSCLPARGKALLIQARRAGQLQVLQTSRFKCSDINNSKASVFVLVHVCVCVSNSSVCLPGLSMKDYLCTCTDTPHSEWMTDTERRDNCTLSGSWNNCVLHKASYLLWPVLGKRGNEAASLKLQGDRQSAALSFSNWHRSEVTGSTNSWSQDRWRQLSWSPLPVKCRWVIGLRVLVLGSVTPKHPSTHTYTYTRTHAHTHMHTCRVLTLLSINTYCNRQMTQTLHGCL